MVRWHTGRAAHGGQRWRHVALLSAVTLLASTAALLAPAVANAVVPAAGTWGGYAIDGTVPDGQPGQVAFGDPSGAGKELGPVGGLKLAELHWDRPQTLTDVSTSAKSDLKNVWIDISQDAAGVPWLYLSWERAARAGGNGSVVVMYEFQKGGQPAGCTYPSPATSCNPWRERKAGDFVVVFDYQGGGVSKIFKRDFVAVGSRLELGTGVLLNAPVPAPGVPVGQAATSADELRGEAAVNLLAGGVFPAVPTSCTSFATIIPYTVTGNSDEAAPEDVVLADTSKAALSNCGTVTVAKTTTPDAGVDQDFQVVLRRMSGGDVRYPAGTKQASGTVNATNATPTTIGSLLPGTDYVLDETAVEDWGLRSVVCGGTTLVQDGVPTGSTFSVAVDATTACTVGNRQVQRDIEVVKGALVAGAAPPAEVALGTVVTYTMTVTNPGNVPLGSVRVEDDLCTGGLATYSTGDTAGDGLLDPGEEWVFSCDYTVTQVDVDAGERDNEATAFGTHGGKEVSDLSTHSLATLSTSGVTASKTASAPQAASGFVVGEVVTYTLALTNAGTVTLTTPGMADPLCAADPVLVSRSANADADLDAGETWTWTCTYTVTQADVDAGRVDNRAVGSGQPPTGPRIEDDATASITTTTAASFSSVKKALVPATTVAATDRKVGDRVLYVVEVTNTGAVTLAGAQVADPGCTPMVLDAASDTGSAGRLSPGETWVHTCETSVTQDDVDRGYRDNTAVVTASRLNGTALPEQRPSARFTTLRTTGMTLTKVPSIAGVPIETAGLGAAVLYTVTATNTGSATLTDVVVTDPLCTLSPTGVAVLAPGQSAQYTCTVTITQTHVDAGTLDNTATATAEAGPDELTRTASATVRLPRTALLAVDKPDPAGTFALGASVPWTVTVRNAGGATLTGLEVTDSLCVLVQSGTDATGPTVLAVGEVQSYTCATPVTAADVLAGSVINAVGATAQDPQGTTLRANDTALALTLPDVRIVVDKTAAPGKEVVAGDVVTYTVTAKNGGNVPLSAVTMADPRCDLGSPTGDTGADGVLGLTETWTWTCLYTVTQDDVDGGPSFGNTATGSGRFGATTDTDTGSAVVATRRDAAILLVKAVKPAVPSAAVVLGSDVVYLLTVTNPGTVSLSGVAVTDPLCAPVRTGGDANGDGRLQPSETWTFECTYRVVQDDVDRGRIDNTATATGTGPAGQVSSKDDETVVVPRDPRLAVTKTAAPATDLELGDAVGYTVTVTNSGTTTLRDVVVQDPLCALVRSSGDDALQVGEVWTYGCTYVVTQADVDRGRIDNTATATAVGGGRTVTGTASATVEVPQSPAIAVDKSALPSQGVLLGQPVQWTVTARNTGNVPLSAVTLTDPMCTLTVTAGDLDADGVLDVGETWTATCTYTATQADVDRGGITNTATGRGTFGGTTVSDTGTATVQLAQGPALSVTKAASPLVFSAVGDVIRYTYVVTNSGTTTLSGPFRVEDDKTPVSCPSTASLGRGASLTCTADYAVTAADLAAGFVTNVARATNGTVVSPEVSARVDEVQVLPTAIPSPSASPSAVPTSPAPAPAAVRPATLPFTGIPVLTVLALGSGGVLVGALLVGAARGRREED